MPAQKGKDLLIKIADGAGGFVTVAGLRTRQLAFNAEAVDVTNAESAGRWRELLGEAGVRRAAVTGAGVFKDETSDARLRQVFFDGAIESYEIVVPDFGRIAGPFQITAFEYRGDHAGEVTFEMAFESAGALTFTALRSSPAPRERTSRRGSADRVRGRVGRRPSPGRFATRPLPLRGRGEASTPRAVQLLLEELLHGVEELHAVLLHDDVCVPSPSITSRFAGAPVRSGNSVCAM